MYQWPSNKISKDDMYYIYLAAKKIKKPINHFIREKALEYAKEILGEENVSTLKTIQKENES